MSKLAALARSANGKGIALISSFHKQPIALKAASAAFFLTLGFRWLLSYFYAGDTPLHDQFDGEWLTVFKPWFSGNFDLATPWQNHNEHIMYLTKAMNLILVITNGSWSPLLSVAMQSLFPAFSAAFFAWLLYKISSKNDVAQMIGFVAIVFSFSSPLLHENMFWGFQSAFMFMVLFSVLASYFVASPAFRDNLWVFPLGFLAFLGSSGGGVAVFLAAGGLMLVRGFCVPRKAVWFSLAASCFALGAYLKTCIGHNPGHDVLKAQDFSQFFHAVQAFALWPGRFDDFSNLFLTWIPVIGCLLFFFFRDFKKWDRFQQFLFVIFAWMIAIFFASAYLRAGTTFNSVPGRYADFLILILPLSVLSLALLKQRFPKSRYLAAFLTLLILFFFGIKSYKTMDSIAETSAERERTKQIFAETVVPYLETNPEKAKAAFFQIEQKFFPYPVAGRTHIWNIFVDKDFIKNMPDGLGRSPTYPPNSSWVTGFLLLGSGTSILIGLVLTNIVFLAELMKKEEHKIFAEQKLC